MINVLVVDDSRYARETLRHIIEKDANLRVIDTAENALEAREKIKSLQPDVVTLDIEMPGMDGIKFLENLIRLRPMPVLMVSSLTQRGTDATMRALEIGAIDYVAKPGGSDGNNLEDFAGQIIEKIKMASAVSLGFLANKSAALAKDLRLQKDRVLPAATLYNPEDFRGLVVAIGASTGGPDALYNLLKPLPKAMPPIMIALHIQPGFSASLAKRLNAQCELEVVEATDGIALQPGRVYLAPGDRHMEYYLEAFRPRLRLHQEAKVNNHRPSVDLLFNSVARYAPTDTALGVILTGMGNDGAQGLLEVRQSGQTTYAQDEASSVVWGMPGRAHEMGAATETLALSAMGAKLVEWSNKRAKTTERSSLFKQS